MFCTKCGRQIDDNATYCPYCNSPTENAGTAPNNAQNNTYYSNNYNNTNYNNTPDTSSVDGMGIAGIILGGIGCLLAWLIALFGYIFGGVGLVLACLGKSKNKDSKVSLAGIIVSAVALGFALLNSLLGILLFASLF